MDHDEQSALTLLSQEDRLFFSHRPVFARLVMAGLARCYVRADGSEWVRLTTVEERAIAAKYSKQAVTV